MNEFAFAKKKKKSSIISGVRHRGKVIFFTGICQAERRSPSNSKGHRSQAAGMRRISDCRMSFACAYALQPEEKAVPVKKPAVKPPEKKEPPKKEEKPDAKKVSKPSLKEVLQPQLKKKEDEEKRKREEDDKRKKEAELEKRQREEKEKRLQEMEKRKKEEEEKKKRLEEERKRKVLSPCLFYPVHSFHAGAGRRLEEERRFEAAGQEEAAI